MASAQVFSDFTGVSNLICNSVGGVPKVDAVGLLDCSAITDSAGAITITEPVTLPGGPAVAGSGTLDTLARFTAASVIGDSSVTEQTSTLTTTKTLIVQGNSNVSSVAAGIKLFDTRPGNGTTFEIESVTQDFKIREVNQSAGAALIWARHSGFTQPRVGLAGGDPNRGSGGTTYGAVNLPKFVPLAGQIQGVGPNDDSTWLIGLSAVGTDPAIFQPYTSLGAYNDTVIGECPWNLFWCDLGAGGAGQLKVFDGRSWGTPPTGAGIQIHNKSAWAQDNGGGIALGGGYQNQAANDPADGTALFAMLYGRKLNNSSGDAKGYLALYTTASSAAGAVTERARLSLGLMVGTTTDSGAGAVNVSGAYYIGGTSVLSSTTLGSGVTASSLTSVGTIGTGVWQGTKISLAYGGTNADLSATGGTSQVLTQTSAGAAVTVAQLAASDLSNGTTGSGAVCLATSPTLVTPVLGVAAGTSLILGSPTGGDQGSGTLNVATRYYTNGTAGLSTTFDVLCDTTDPTKKRTITVTGGLVTDKGTCA